MSTLVTILRPTVQLGMNSWLDFGLWRSRRVGSPTTVAEGYRRWPEANSALSRRKQGFESPRERHIIKHLGNIRGWRGIFDLKSTDNVADYQPISRSVIGLRL